LELGQDLALEITRTDLGPANPASHIRTSAGYASTRTAATHRGDAAHRSV
jgi:hypothetical protein